MVAPGHRMLSIDNSHPEHPFGPDGTSVAVCECGQQFLGVGSLRLGEARLGWARHEHAAELWFQTNTPEGVGATAPRWNADTHTPAALEMHATGMSASAIGRELGFARGTVTTHLRKAGAVIQAAGWNDTTRARAKAAA